ncbi:amidohydrolase family protein [Pelotalea chapellei]|uniref:amidohydrolase family protein n=1 Tax=Pelotalea chapellei TaxID=44671 RepID=UPI001FE8CA4B|nr:amidohydrolase family protein [Pelotalea chapellei]
MKFIKPDMLCGEIHQISVWQPTVIIDSHMHIQSGHCATEQFVQYQGPLAPVQSGLKFSRGLIEGSGEIFGGLLTLFEWFATKPVKQIAKVFSDKPENPQEGYLTKNAVLDLVTMQAKSTSDIADLFIKERNNLVDDYFKNPEKCPFYKDAPYLFFSSVVMTMDMEYSHIDGYFGIRVYNPLFEEGQPIDVTQPSRYWSPAHGKWVETYDYEGNPINGRVLVKPRNKTVYKKIDDPAKVVLIDKLNSFNDYKEIEKTGIIIGNCCDPQNGELRRVSIEAAPVLMSDAETEKYENWEKQLKSTEEAVIKYPLKFLPMFHYDPRRWQFKGEGVNADLITKVMGENALYLGFKMYTAQGFRPWDVRRLPTLKDFYAKCCKNGIPIMNHCTPGGARSHEDNEFYNFEHPFDDEFEEQEQRKGKNQNTYFEDNFVSPKAWEKVFNATVDLKDGKQPLNTLRLCLAHFGGPAKPGPEWSQQIIDMITSNKYPNLYTDISSSFADEKFRKYFKELFTGKLSEEQKKKMRSRILFGTDWYMTLAYGALNKKNLWDYCTETKDWLDTFDTSLWPYFTQYNPYRFYKLETEVPRITKNIIKKMEKNKKVFEELENYQIEEIEQEAAWIQAANKAHVCYEETP